MRRDAKVLLANSLVKARYGYAAMYTKLGHQGLHFSAFSRADGSVNAGTQGGPLRLMGVSRYQ
jgi:hypothetical protein